MGPAQRPLLKFLRGRKGLGGKFLGNRVEDGVGVGIDVSVWSAYAIVSDGGSDSDAEDVVDDNSTGFASILECNGDFEEAVASSI